MHDIIFDSRWKGMHGIGRFAAEVEGRMKFTHVDLRGNPASPLDWLYLSVKLTARKQGFFSPLATTTHCCMTGRVCWWFMT